MHFPLIVVGANYLAPDSIFQSSRTVSAQVEAIRAGRSVAPRASERILRKQYLRATARKPVRVMAWGSSRSLPISRQAVGTNSYMNMSASYGVLFDLAALYSLMERNHNFPARLIVGLDGWMLNRDVDVRSWMEYGRDVERGLTLVGMRDAFDDEIEGGSAKEQELLDNLRYLFSPAIFSNTVLGAVEAFHESGALPVLPPSLKTAPIDLKKDPWDSDFSYWYPCVAANEVEDRARNWATPNAMPGEQRLEGDFTAIDPQRIALLKALLRSFAKHRVKLYLFLPPLHPLSYAQMEISPARRLTVEAEKIFRAIAAELKLPIYGSYDPALSGLEAEDFCTDALHIRPDVMTRVFRNTKLADDLRK
ncbi:MAG: hypothetical protein VW600_04850 [Ferrovibrio sp.]